MGVFSKWWQNFAESTEDIIRDELTNQANEMVGVMRSRIHPLSGHLDKSIRVEQVPSRRGQPIVAIKAGGPLTTKSSAKGKPYDYALAEEFGTQREAARPFFFVTVRENKQRAYAAVRARVAETMQTGWIK
jgi:hypothetical protein